MASLTSVGGKVQAAAFPPIHSVTHTAPIKIGPIVIPWRMPSPRALAASVLTVVGFGAALGAAGLSVAEAPIRVFLGLGSQTPTAQQTANSGGSGGGVTTIVETQGGGAQTGSGNQNTGGSSTPSSTNTGTTPTTPGPLPPVKHLWVIDLDGQGYNQTFATGSPDTYLSGTLAPKGEVVSGYYATSQSPLANEVAMVSGQGPTKAMLEDCPSFDAIAPGKVSKKDAQVLGQGCVFPKTTQTLFNQLNAAGLTWKTYVQGLGAKAKAPASQAEPTTSTSTTTSTNVTAAAARLSMASALGAISPLTVSPHMHADLGSRTGTARTAKSPANSNLAATCRHPVLGSKDGFNTVTPADQYVTWRNPIAYFPSLTESKKCGASDVGTNELTLDLQSSESTPNVSFIFPNPCADGSDTPCLPGSPAGTAQSDRFLQSVVPQIMASAAYKTGGMIVITFNEAPQSGEFASQASCCNTPKYPNLPNTSTSTTPTTTTTTSTGTTQTVTTPTGSTSSTGNTTGTTGTATSPAGTGSSPTSTTTPTGTDTTGTGTGSTSTTTTPPLCTDGLDVLGNPCTGGGGQVGLLVLTKYVTAGSADTTDEFNHFSLLLSIEKLFGLKPLGYAAQPGTAYFQGTLFYQKYKPGP